MTPRDKIAPALGKRKAAFRQSDLARALRALEQTGHDVRQVTIEDGKICIVTGAPEPAEPVAADKPTTQSPKQVWLDLARKRG